MLKYFTALCFFFLFVNSFYVSAQTERKVAVLDMTNYNGETGTSRKLSAIRVMRLMGVPYEVTTNLSVAIQYPVIITGSRILDGAFTLTERTDLENYVNDGGVLITSSVRDPDFYPLCGINSSTSSNTLYKMTWDTTAAPIFDYVNDSLEVTVSIGDTASGFSFYTRYYGLNGANSLATYENGECALALHPYGNGSVYTFGPDFRDVLYRNQTNFDVNAHRTYSNGFEPTSDVIMFVLRNIVRNHIPHTLYKYTAPYDYSSTLMITHDIDSETGMDTMQAFSDYELSEGISAHYNVTTRYFSDSWMSSFYVGSWSEVHALLDDGHVLSSHSVGHFPDFDDENLFPLGDSGNTTTSYTPAYNSGVSSGGSVMGELEVSKFLLEDDHGVHIRSFRAGHLAFNDSLVLGLEKMKYEFNSTNSANNVLSSFPHYAMKIRSFNSEESSILEIPMTISDVFSSDPITPANYPQKVAVWVDATQRYDENHSPVVLLIHPNRNYKLTALQDYLALTPQNQLIYPFEKYGDYWRKRDSLQFATELNGNVLTVTIDDNLLTQEQSFVLDHNGLDSVIFKNQMGDDLTFLWKDWKYNSRLYYQGKTSSSIPENFTSKENNLHVYPNPTHSTITIYISGYTGYYQLQLYDLSGKLILSKEQLNAKTELDLRTAMLENGAYILTVQTDTDQFYKKISYLK
ncbi:MAG: T9SS type A sorting domain-containing protein [Crocinitomicaceae bacterium]